MIVEFHSAATGYPTDITWKWQGSPDNSLWLDLTNGSSYEGVTTPNLEVEVVDESLNGWWFRAVANNGPLTAISNAAQLTVTNGTGA